MIARANWLRDRGAAALRSAGLSVVLASGAAAQEAGRAAGTAAVPAAPAAPCDPAVELVRALAWPAIALVIAALFRRPLSAFVGALGTRVTKLSVFNVALELVPATSATATPLLDDIRTATNPALINDSTRMMLEQVQIGAPADYAMVALGTGDEWLTSRLFIAAVMLERMRGVKVLVFVESSPSSDRRFVAVASVRDVRWALAQRYPHLEAAWARAYLRVFPPNLPVGAPMLPAEAAWLPDPKTMTAPLPVITSSAGALAPGEARQVVSRFIDSLQRPAAAPPPGPPAAEWVTLGVGVPMAMPVEERAEWVTRQSLGELLPADAFRAWTDERRDASRAKLTRAVLRRGGAFVALTEGDRDFVRLVNRSALLEEIAAAGAEEPDEARR